MSTIASYYFKHLVGMPAEAYYPTVFKNHESPDWTGLVDRARILCVGVSQSGTSVSTCEAMLDGFAPEERDLFGDYLERARTNLKTWASKERSEADE